MSNGLLGKAVSSADTFVTPYTVPAAVQFATITVACVNMDVVPAKVRVAITLAGTPGEADYVEYDAELPANGGILERTCLVLSPNEKVMIYSNSAHVAARVFGLEQS